ncbi:MAG: ATP-binding protein [Candidatus Thorarchaeota archaeon]
MEYEEEGSEPKANGTRHRSWLDERTALESPSILNILKTLLEMREQPAFVVSAEDFSILSMNSEAGHKIVSSNPECFLSVHRPTNQQASSFSCRAIDRVLETKKHVHLQHTHMLANGTSCEHLISATPILDSKGHVTHILEVWHSKCDVNAWEAQPGQHDELNYRRIMENLNDIVFVYDSMNRRAECYGDENSVLFRFSAKLLGRHVKDLMPHEAAQEFVKAAEAARSNGLPATIEYPLTIVGETRFFSENLILHEDGESIVSVAKDITEERQAESRIIEQRNFLERVIESLTHPFYVIDAQDFSIKMANSAANLGNINSDAKCYALTHNRDFPCSGDDHPCPLATIKESKESAVVEHIHFDSEDNMRFVKVHAYPVLNSEGKLVQIIEYALDVTDQRWAEEQLALESKRARLYLDLLGHDMANELQVIQGSVELLAEVGHNEEARSITERLHRQVIDSVNRCNSMIINARATEKLPTAPLIERPLNRVIGQCIKAANETFDGVKIVLETEVDKDVVLADKYLEDLFSNLIQNAAQHNKSPCRQIWISILNARNGIEISIADNGPGIEEKLKKYLFDPFQRIGGIGLHFSAEIAKKYGGSIRVRDRIPGRYEEGVEFVIWLPKPRSLSQ